MIFEHRILYAAQTSREISMAYDKIDWHCGSGFPEDLPMEAAATHIGMFVVWMLLKGLGSASVDSRGETLRTALRVRSVTPGEFFLRQYDGKFLESDLSEEGNEFARAYYGGLRSKYIQDYESVLCGGLPSSYHVDDSWENFDRIAAIIDSRYERWKRSNNEGDKKRGSAKKKGSDKKKGSG